MSDQEIMSNYFQMIKENLELKAKIEKVSGDALSNYYKNVELKARIAELENHVSSIVTNANMETAFLKAQNDILLRKASEDHLNSPIIYGIDLSKDATNKIKAEAILEAISTLGTHWADNIGEEVIRVDLLERYADKLRLGES